MKRGFHCSCNWGHVLSCFLLSSSAGDPGGSDMVVFTEWHRAALEQKSSSGLPMSGEDTGLGASAPPLAGYLGKVSWAHVSPLTVVTCAKLIHIWETQLLGSNGNQKNNNPKKAIWKSLVIKGERFSFRLKVFTGAESKSVVMLLHKESVLLSSLCWNLCTVTGHR